MFTVPDMSDTPASIEGTTPIGDSETSNVVETQSQSSIDLSWDDPAPSQIESVYCSVGSTPDKSDVFPETPVRYKK